MMIIGNTFGKHMGFFSSISWQFLSCSNCLLECRCVICSWLFSFLSDCVVVSSSTVAHFSVVLPASTGTDGASQHISPVSNTEPLDQFKKINAFVHLDKKYFSFFLFKL